MGKFINRVCSLALVLSILPVYDKQPTSAETQNQDEHNQVMVTYKSNQEDIKTIDVPTGESTSDFINKLENEPNVADVEPDYIMTRSATINDPYYSEQWYHQTIGTEDAWDVTTGSNDMVVAVIDDGIDLHHRDLSNQIISPYDVVLNSKSRISIGEHGTHVSGIIASTMNNRVGGTGIAPNVKIMPINVFDGAEASYSDVITGIDYAIKHGADIINLSLGGTEPSDMLNDAIQRAYKAGILIVAAAGNEHTFAFDYPAAYDHVIGVSATDKYDRFATDFSNYGSDIDLAAPGTDIFSTFPDNRYGYLDGTSMATPVVSGVAALVWSANPSFTNAQVEEQLYKTADDLGPKGKDIYYGNGRINASKAVKVIEEAKVKTPELTVNEIADNDTVITGQLSTSIQDGTVTIYTGNRILATTNLVNSDTFSITIPKQLAGTKIYIKVDNPTIHPIELTVVDQTPPANPTVNPVADNTTQIKGTAEAGTTVKVQTGSKQLGTVLANSLGKWTVILDEKQTAGTKLTITASDSAGNISTTVTKTVQDKTPPEAPVVNKVTSKTTKITGKVEPYSTIFLQKNGKIIGTAKATSMGTFSIKISKKNANKTLYIYARDKVKNTSKRVAVTF